MDKDKYYAKPDKTIKEHYQDLIMVLKLLKEYHYIVSGELYDLLVYACEHHDDGKANTEFQKRVRKIRKKLRFNSDAEVPHNVLSGYFINPDDFENKEDYYRVLYAVLYHHDYGDALSLMKDKKTLIKALLEEFHTYSIKNSTRNRVAEMVQDTCAIKIKGFLHKCDYSASGNFVAEYPNDFLTESLENMKLKWRVYDPDSDWNELQRFCMKKRGENIIVTAQTGMGKTEAGLQWIGNSKGYFVLPLRTAINAIYDRVREDILQNVSLDKRLSILHSESLEYYANQLEGMELDLYDYKCRGKQFSMPLNISTMDQLFDFIFKYQGFELKLTTFSYSKIVIDEIQMYAPDLLAYLIYGLKWIRDMGGKIAIMTATLSPFIKELLMRAIPFKEENIRTFVNDTIRHNIKVLDCYINTEDIIEKYQENNRNGKSNKILVVCNTIGKAQELYEEMKGAEETTDFPVRLLHSRYTKKDRGELEKEILEFGRTLNNAGEVDKRSGIWISTSLVEASLDIDFDYLYTELQDLNSLLQRLGRCNRKGMKDVSNPNCFIYTQIDQSLLSGESAFIDGTIYHLSRQAIQTVNGTFSEVQKLDLLNKSLTMEQLKDSKYYRKYKDAETFVKDLAPYKLQKQEAQLRNILSENVIPSPVYIQHKDEIHEWERSIEEDKMSYVERMKLKSYILQYSVNIPYWQWMAYNKAMNKGDADYYPQIQLGRKERIQVVECLYDELGYRRMDYKNVIREPEIL